MNAASVRPWFWKGLAWVLAGGLAFSAALRAADAPAAASADPLARWGGVSTGTTLELAQVIWTGTQFVAAGGHIIMTSPDGLNWKTRDLGDNKIGLQGVASNGKMCVAVGNAGFILSSPDLANWTTRDAGGARKYSSVVWTGREFVVMGDTGDIAHSPDGINWVGGSATSGGAVLGNNFTHGTWGGNLLVVGSTTALISSPDGVDFTPVINNNEQFHDVAWGNGIFVAVGENSVLTSPDGLAWSKRDPGIRRVLNGVCWTGKEFITVGNHGLALASPDGITWKQLDSGNVDVQLLSVASNDTVGVAVGQQGVILSTNAKKSSDMNSASLTPLPTSTPQTTGPAGDPLGSWTTALALDHPIQQIIWQNNQFLATTTGKLISSPDGLTWRVHPVGTRVLYGVASDGKTTVVVGDKGYIATSTDLDTWTVRNTGATSRLYGVVWDGKQFTVMGDGGVELASVDGATWATVPRASSSNYHHGIWTGSQYVFATGSGIRTSADGVTWTTPLSNTDRLMDVAWNGNTFVAVAANVTTVFTSPDSQRWTPQPVPVGKGLNDVAWADSQFIAIGNTGILATSPDGTAWTAHSFDPRHDLYAVAAHNGTVAIGTYQGLVLVNKLLDPKLTPTITLEPGTGGNLVQLTITCPTPGAKIYYSEDGTDPTPQSQLYSGPMVPPHSCTIHARAYDSAGNPGEVFVASFTAAAP